MGSLSQHVGSSSCGLWHLLVGACEMFIVPECRIFVAACGILLRHVGSLAVACGILVAAFRVFLIVAGRIFAVPCGIFLVLICGIFVAACGIF